MPRCTIVSLEAAPDTAPEAVAWLSESERAAAAAKKAAKEESKPSKKPKKPKKPKVQRVYRERVAALKPPKLGDTGFGAGGLLPAEAPYVDLSHIFTPPAQCKRGAAQWAAGVKM